MDEDFELQYADELDALEDIEPPDYTPCKTKRSLHFDTPRTKITNSDCVDGDVLDTSFPTPLESPGVFNNNRLSQVTNGDIDTPKSRKRIDKRARSNENENLSDSDDSSCLKRLAPQSKRARVQDTDDPVCDISPPVSPGIEDKIVKLRSIQGTRQNTSDKQERSRLVAEDYDIAQPRVHRRIPSGDFICITGYEGDRVYIKKKDETSLNKEYENVGKSLKRTGLLALSIEELKDQLENDRQQKLLDEAEQIVQISKELNKEKTDEETNDVEDEDGNDSWDQNLWVEKYAPQRYTDLLSEESINRTLLQWLKLWDYVVFGKDVKMKKKENAKQQKDFKKKKYQPEVLEELDKHNRPIQKIVLINGPPGLGKTTLAHVIAKHCGYNVVEINASDDRSADVFKTKLESATQMKSVLEADPRPNCLVIDEIDGAPQAAINILINFVKRTDDPTDKKKKDGGILLRPIICICNDQYVPALRGLRQNALLMNFPQTDPARLASRLAEVTKAEQFKADLNALLALGERTDNDIRSCLNTLQFCKEQHKELTIRIVQAMNIGNKDSNKSLFSMWYDIFSMPRPKRNRFVSLHDIKDQDWRKNNNTSLSARFDTILRAAYSTGDYTKLIQGMFENVLECKYKDPKMDGLNLAMDWLVFTDLINQYIAGSQDYSMMPYIPYITVAYHFIFASNQMPKIQYPHTDYEAFTKQQRSSNLVTSLMSDMVPTVRKFVNETVSVMEVLPPLMDIIQPTLRPVNTQLYSSREKEDLVHLINIMVGYNMTYVQERTKEGQYTYVLDPNMDEVVKFTGMKQHRQLTYAAKQMIAREISLEKLRKTESSKIQQGKSGTDNKKKGSSDSKRHVPNHLQKLKAQPLIKKEEVVSKDFFGRKIVSLPEEKKVHKEEKKNVLNTDIWFHFTEGFSNAVRKNVRIQDLL